MIEKTSINDLYVITPRIFEDQRGYFFESYNQVTFNKITGIDVNFVQDNQSYSTYGTIRGLHWQSGEYAQSKLVRVLQGKVLDIAVDLREDSPTYGEHYSVELSSENNKQLFIPKGFAHGFSVLSKTATFFYKCDNFYNKESEQGIIYNDSELSIDWGIPKEEEIVSSKDLLLPTFKEIMK